MTKAQQDRITQLQRYIDRAEARLIESGKALATVKEGHLQARANLVECKKSLADYRKSIKP